MEILKLLLILPIAFISCNSSQESEETNAVAFDSTRWIDSDLPVSLKIASDYASGVELAAISSSAQEWSTAVENKLQFFKMGGSTPNKEYANLSDYNDNEMGVYKLNTWSPELPSTALAVTQLFGFQNEAGGVVISHADILMNEETYTFSTDSDDSFNYDFETVMLHELGHFIGLSHSSFSETSVMIPSISLTDSNRVSSSLDRANAAYNYELETSYSNALIASGPSTVAIHSSIESEEEDPTGINQGKMEKNGIGEVRILIHLMASGECIHEVNGKVISSHQVDLHSKRTLNSK